MNWLLKLVASQFGGQIIGGLVDGYKAKLDAGNTRDSIAADLAGKELLVQQREVELSAQLRIAQVGVWYEPEHLAGYVLVFYMAKIYIWDAALHLGSTDAVNGAVGEWGALIMAFLFGKRGIENVARILRRP